MVWSGSAWADHVGVIDMQQIFQSSPQVNKINGDLNKQFSPQRDKIVAMGRTLEADIKKLNRDQSVMDKTSLGQLKDKITKEEQTLRTAQGEFQQALMAAQNKAMEAFMTQLNKVVTQVAEKKELQMVLPKTVVLYAKDSVDITADVASGLKG